MRKCKTIIPVLSLLAGLQMALPAQGQMDFWDRAPIRYSDTVASNKLTELSAALASGKAGVTEMGGLGRLRLVLKALGIPAESQVLVFSKTSLQNDLIQPTNPRALYFSENAYVGYVPGGAIEAVVQDPVLGPVFYFVGTDREGEPVIERDTNRCMSCHATSRTENVPGLLIRSVFPDEAGHPLLHLGTTDVADQTPLAERWGGWYVTGRSDLPHLGNRTFTEDGEPNAHVAELDDLKSQVDVSRYLRPTSDIVALLVLEHQCRMHTLLNAASMNYRRSRFFSETIAPGSDPDKASAGLVAESWAEKITDCIFFKDEADLGEGVEGDAAFQKAFAARFPKTKDGDSLADFRLYGRIFKRRCSFMVYSDAFRDLPPSVKGLVLGKMRKALAGEDERITWLGDSERKRIDHILSETLPGWMEGKAVAE
jgi:hypothetical protein